MGAVTNFVCYYFIGIPLLIYLALYRGLGIMGVWTGLAVALFIQVYMIILRCTLLMVIHTVQHEYSPYIFSGECVCSGDILH